MTSISVCEKCSTLRYRLDGQNKVASEGEMGWKSSCCGTCSNPKCEDYGECDCFDSRIEQMTELLRQRIAEGWVPDNIEIYD
jgi:hypothetical protein